MAGYYPPVYANRKIRFLAVLQIVNKFFTRLVVASNGFVYSAVKEKGAS